MNGNVYYGRGISFPFRVDATGGIAVSAGVTKVEQSILMILGTQFGERVMRPTFGCNLKSLVFAPNNQATANLARFYVQDGLTRWEPRIDVLDVVAENDNVNGILVISIHYRLKASQDVRSMVYPFYLEQP
jgi:phage baseplate assembly protein W